MMFKYTAVDSRGREIFIDADNLTWSGEYNLLSFSKGSRIIAIFNTNNIIGFYEKKERERERLN